MPGRRDFLVMGGLAGAASCIGMPYTVAKELRKTEVIHPGDADIKQQLAALEAHVGGRLGVSIADGVSGRHWHYRADERFPMCSTFKLLVAAALLKRVDGGLDRLDQRIVFRPAQVLQYSPGTAQHAGGNGLSLAQLCEAMLTLSDNTAANLLLERVGGLSALNRFIRALGDSQTRLDRIEPYLNSGVPGDVRDTTTPAAMRANLQRLVLSDLLTPGSRQQLIDWLKANRTGDQRVRAGLPPGWIVGDKTGSGGFGTTNTVAVIWPQSERPPLLAALYLTQTKAPEAQRNAVLADVGRLIAQRW